MPTEELQKLVSEAQKCLERAGRAEAGDTEQVVDVRTAKSMFVNFYGRKLSCVVGEVVKEEETDHEDR
jgi:hypothetical protein